MMIPVAAQADGDDNKSDDSGIEPIQTGVFGKGVNRMSVPTDRSRAKKPQGKIHSYLYAVLGLNVFMCIGMNYVFDFP